MSQASTTDRAAALAAAFEVVEDSLPAVYEGSLPELTKFVIDPSHFTRTQSRIDPAEQVSDATLSRALAAASVAGPTWGIEAKSENVQCQEGKVSVCVMPSSVAQAVVGKLEELPGGNLRVHVSTSVMSPVGRRLSTVSHIVTLEQVRGLWLLASYERVVS